jgi:acyl-CoA thioesterase-1
MSFKISTIIYIVLGIVCTTCVYFFFIKKDAPETALTQPVQTFNDSDAFTIVAFGDSLTAGYGVNLEDSYPSLLENILKEKSIRVKILNMGVSGETTSGGLDRVQFVIDQKPNLVLLGIGDFG